MYLKRISDSCFQIIYQLMNMIRGIQAQIIQVKNAQGVKKSTFVVIA